MIAPLITAHGFTAAYIPSFFMRSSCDALIWFTCASTQRRFLMGCSLIDGLDLVEERIDGIVQFRMHVQGQAGLGDLHSHAAPLLELIRPRIGLEREHRVMQRRVHAFAKSNIVDVAVALKQLHPGDLLEGPVHLLRSAGRGAADTKDPDIQPVLRFPFLKDFEDVGVATRDAERGETRSIHVLDQGRAAGFKLIRRYLGQLGRPRRECPRCRP